MRWLTFIILAMLGIAFQTTLAERLAIGGVRPEWMIVLLVHYGLQARGTDGLLAAWVLGLLVDLGSVQPVGVAALAYGLAGVAIYGIRGLVFPRHPLTHFMLTMCGAILIQLMLYYYYCFSFFPNRGNQWGWVLCLGGGVYTAAWAVPMMALLLRLGRPLGLVRNSGALLIRRGRIHFV